VKIDGTLIAALLFALSAILFILAAVVRPARHELLCVAAAAFAAAFAALTWP
jgi:hypothetical protein